MQWSDFSNLTPAQRAKLAEFAAIGTVMGGLQPTPNPDTSAVTYSQAKQAQAFLRELHTLVGPVVTAARFVIQKGRDKALSDFDSANP